MIMTALYRFLLSKVELLRDLPPLIFRLILSYGFYGPALEKAENIENVIGWFRDSLGIPAPELNAYLSVTTECTGFVCLFLGLATRIISVPLMVVMVVAIATVHYPNGFACGKNGFEVPFYYFFMLFSLVITGPGRISVDYLIKKHFIKE